MNSNITNLAERGIIAVERYLVRRGYEIVQRGFEGPAGVVDLIATEDDALVFVDVNVQVAGDGGFPTRRVDDSARIAFELNAIEFLRGYDEVDVAVRADVVDVIALSDERAMIRHHVSAISAA